MDLIIYTFSFVFVSLASYLIGKLFSQWGLPKITGYLLAGAVAGPFVLALMDADSGTQLRYIDELSLAVIAFVAGSELYLKEIRSRLKTISLLTTAVMIVGTILMGVSLFFLTEFISFTQGMPIVSRLAVAILGGVILLALSPASTIAVIKDVRARGQYTSTVLGVTVTMDVVVILLFAVAVAIASVLLTGSGFNASFVGLLLLDLGAAIGIGFLVGKVLQFVLARPWNHYLKIGLVLAIGYAIFALAYAVVQFSYANLPFEIHIEPILIAMIGGFYVTNFTNSRDEFDEILHDVGPAVYVAFFTLTGLGLKLDILFTTLPIALALFAVRAGSIFLGGYVGGRLAGESEKHSRYYWLGLITQAGIALGLAREVANEFP
ncbi:MAG: cation:proton antiporter, partial [Anaerolineales bacterium]|nr:cation:proton antiporter [Anaerolineales bacterium]